MGGYRQVGNANVSMCIRFTRVSFPLLIVTLALYYAQNSRKLTHEHREEDCMQELPIACSLTPAEIEARRSTLLPGLVAQAVERLPIPDGFRWRFEASDAVLAAAVETINAERQCCRFLRFVLTVEPNGRALWLDITGAQGTVAFLEALLQCHP
jgi:hypothetical protein